MPYISYLYCLPEADPKCFIGRYTPISDELPEKGMLLSSLGEENGLIRVQQCSPATIEFMVGVVVEVYPNNDVRVEREGDLVVTGADDLALDSVVYLGKDGKVTGDRLSTGLAIGRRIDGMHLSPPFNMSVITPINQLNRTDYEVLDAIMKVETIAELESAISTLSQVLDNVELRLLRDTWLTDKEQFAFLVSQLEVKLGVVGTNINDLSTRFQALADAQIGHISASVSVFNNSLCITGGTTEVEAGTGITADITIGDNTDTYNGLIKVDGTYLIEDISVVSNVVDNIVAVVRTTDQYGKTVSAVALGETRVKTINPYSNANISSTANFNARTRRITINGLVSGVSNGKMVDIILWKDKYAIGNVVVASAMVDGGKFAIDNVVVPESNFYGYGVTVRVLADTGRYLIDNASLSYTDLTGALVSRPKDTSYYYDVSDTAGSANVLGYKIDPSKDVIYIYFNYKNAKVDSLGDASIDFIIEDTFNKTTEVFNDVYDGERHAFAVKELSFTELGIERPTLKIRFTGIDGLQTTTDVSQLYVGEPHTHVSINDISLSDGNLNVDLSGESLRSTLVPPNYDSRAVQIHHRVTNIRTGAFMEQTTVSEADVVMGVGTSDVLDITDLGEGPYVLVSTSKASIGIDIADYRNIIPGGFKVTGIRSVGANAVHVYFKATGNESIKFVGHDSSNQGVTLADDFTTFTRLTDERGYFLLHSLDTLKQESITIGGQILDTLGTTITDLVPYDISKTSIDPVMAITMLQEDHNGNLIIRAALTDVLISNGNVVIHLVIFDETGDVVCDNVITPAADVISSTVDINRLSKGKLVVVASAVGITGDVISSAASIDNSVTAHAVYSPRLKLTDVSLVNSVLEITTVFSNWWLNDQLVYDAKVVKTYLRNIDSGATAVYTLEGTSAVEDFTSKTSLPISGLGTGSLEVYVEVTDKFGNVLWDRITYVIPSTSMSEVEVLGYKYREENERLEVIAKIADPQLTNVNSVDMTLLVCEEVNKEKSISTNRRFLRDKYNMVSMTSDLSMYAEDDVSALVHAARSDQSLMSSHGEFIKADIVGDVNILSTELDQLTKDLTIKFDCTGLAEVSGSTSVDVFAFDVVSGITISSTVVVFDQSLPEQTATINTGTFTNKEIVCYIAARDANYNRIIDHVKVLAMTTSYKYIKVTDFARRSSGISFLSGWVNSITDGANLTIDVYQSSNMAKLHSDTVSVVGGRFEYSTSLSDVDQYVIITYGSTKSIRRDLGTTDLAVTNVRIIDDKAIVFGDVTGIQKDTNINIVLSDSVNQVTHQVTVNGHGDFTTGELSLAGLDRGELEVYASDTYVNGPSYYINWT